MNDRQRYIMNGLRMTKEQAGYIFDLIRRVKENSFQRGKIDAIIDLYKSGELEIENIDKVNEDVCKLARENLELEDDIKELVDKYTLFVV